MKYAIDKNNIEPSFAGLAQRREFLTGLAALGASALLPGCASNAQAPGMAGAKPYRIDVHHHFVTPVYTAALKAHGIRQVRWTVQGSLEDMDKSGIAASISSLPPPAISFGDLSLGRKLAREANEYAAKLASDYPRRFGSFASIPLPDTAGSLNEIAYALDTLKAEGIGMMTSYGGKYLGDPLFWPVLEELNRKKAVVYTHPTRPLCCTAVLPALNINTIEAPVDTTRTIASLLFGGAAARYPDIRWIFSHSGGVAPFLLSRFMVQEQIMKDAKQKLPQGVMYELRKFYYETAQGNHPGALAALMQIAPISQVLYGTDYPFRHGAEVNAGLAQYGYHAADLMAIDRDNALRLMPRLKA